jgi:o-succinylbenzoate---CoA ligase
VIITGGENVVAAQVEAFLAGHPAVDQVAVVGRPDREWGERVTAVVVPRGDAPSLADLRSHARPHLPRHALPAELEIVEVLPLLATGKVDREALRRAPAGPEQR